MKDTESHSFGVLIAEIGYALAELEPDLRTELAEKLISEASSLVNEKANTHLSDVSDTNIH